MPADELEEWELHLIEPMPGQRVSSAVVEVEMSGFQKFQQEVAGL